MATAWRPNRCRKASAVRWLGRALGPLVVLRPDAKDVPRIVAAADQDLDVFQQRRERAAGLLPAPQLAAVVAVAAYGHAQPPGRGQAGVEHLYHRRARGRSRAGEVQPVLAREDCVPIEIRRPELAEAARRPVVDHLGRPAARVPCSR